MKSKVEPIPASSPAGDNQFSDFFKPQNQANVKEALRRVTVKANSEQKAVIMTYRSGRTADCC